MTIYYMIQMRFVAIIYNIDYSIMSVDAIENEKNHSTWTENTRIVHRTNLNFYASLICRNMFVQMCSIINFRLCGEENNLTSFQIVRLLNTNISSLVITYYSSSVWEAIWDLFFFSHFTLVSLFRLRFIVLSPRYN